MDELRELADRVFSIAYEAHAEPAFDGLSDAEIARQFIPLARFAFDVTQILKTSPWKPSPNPQTPGNSEGI